VASALEAIGNLATLGRGGRFLYGDLHHQLPAAKDSVAVIGHA
jgi:hypothetical protein